MTVPKAASLWRRSTALDVPSSTFLTAIPGSAVSEMVV